MGECERESERDGDSLSETPEKVRKLWQRDRRRRWQALTQLRRNLHWVQERFAHKL